MINNETYNTRVNLFSIPRPSRSQQEPISLVSKKKLVEFTAKDIQIGLGNMKKVNLIFTKRNSS